MSIKNILALIVLMSFGIYDVIQGEMIYGVDIPKINASRMNGRWFMVASTLEVDQSACSTIDMKTQSADTFSIHIAHGTNFDKTGSSLAENYKSTNLNATVTNDSNLIFTTIDGKPGPCLAFFDVVHNSYIAIYSSLEGRKLPSDAQGSIVVFSRQRSLPKKILEKIKKSKLYLEAPRMGMDLKSIDSTTCH